MLEVFLMFAKWKKLIPLIISTLFVIMPASNLSLYIHPASDFISQAYLLTSYANWQMPSYKS